MSCDVICVLCMYLCVVGIGDSDYHRHPTHEQDTCLKLYMWWLLTEAWGELIQWIQYWIRYSALISLSYQKLMLTWCASRASVSCLVDGCFSVVVYQQGADFLRFMNIWYVFLRATCMDSFIHFQVKWCTFILVLSLVIASCSLHFWVQVHYTFWCTFVSETLCTV